MCVQVAKGGAIPLLVEMLAEKEGQMEEEGFSLSVLVQDGTTGENIGRANVNLWRMIEDSCNILRQEVDIISVSGSAGAVIGSIIIDVRGFPLLKAATP